MNAAQAAATRRLLDKIVAGIPMRRIAAPAVIADAAVFPAADESRYMSGAELAVDGASSA